MNCFFVFQNKSYNKERKGGYLWAPKTNKTGKRVSHWVTMESVKKGDLIIHSFNKKIISFSIAKDDCYESEQPVELQEEKLWEDEGWRVDVDHIDIVDPIITSDHKDRIMELQPKTNAPFNCLGRGNTGYLFHSNKELSQYIIHQTELIQKTALERNRINELRKKLGLLFLDEIQILDDFGLVDGVENSITTNNESIDYEGVPKEKVDLKVNEKGKKTYPRLLSISVNALRIADFKCEYDNNHNTFIRKKDGNPYTEPHHLIPLSMHSEFEYSLDVEENIVSLCSHCHNLLHYGSEKVDLLRKLYDDRKSMLEKVGLNTTFEQLLKYY
ncbi:HNH endonuclease [Tepidibacter sp. Z1-5]|uniref:HNH endonuclease n=1 Tax=Tepidibacter sp. Z1-5 TaxID=3134138 RepID=UPI0030BB7C8B